jgi:hypothetical protein
MRPGLPHALVRNASDAVDPLAPVAPAVCPVAASLVREPYCDRRELRLRMSSPKPSTSNNPPQQPLQTKLPPFLGVAKDKPLI